MAEKKNITRAQALQFAIDNVDNDEVKEVLGNMLAQVTKPRKAAVSKARKINENLAAKVVKAMAENGTPSLTSKEIVALGMPDVATTQKAAAVMRVAEELGLAHKVKDGKKISYVLTEDEDVEGE